MKNRRWYLIAGLLLVGAVLFVAIFADRITPVSPHYMDERTTVLEGRPPFAPGGVHPLGTDAFGRDLWSRVAYGTRWSLLYAGLVMAARLLIALPMGVAAAFGPRFFRWLVGRLYVFTSSIPPLVIYLAVLYMPSIRFAPLSANVGVTVVLLTLIEWPRLAVYLQGRLEELASDPFVEGAVAVGAPPWRIFTRHLLPHLWATLLQLISGEMGRALLVIAQLGIFGIWVGGGITEQVGDPPRPTLITGIPEWGTLLAETRAEIRNHPWMPMAPATAFLIGMAGFHLLSQGLEGLTFSLYRLREATTGRLSKWWRLALIPLVAVPGFFWYRELTRNDIAEVLALMERQTQALTERDTERYMATISERDPAYRTEQRRWLESMMKTDYAVAVARTENPVRDGREIKTAWTLSFGYEEAPPVTVTRAVRLVPAADGLQESRGDFTHLRGFHTDLYAVYDPLDDSEKGAFTRWQIRKVATAADRAYARAAAYFPDRQGGLRPQLYLYASHNSFRVAAGAESDQSKLTYAPGEPIRISPAILAPFDPYELERTFARVMIQSLAHDQSVAPLALGFYEQKAGARGGQYWVNPFALTDRPLFSVSELLAVKEPQLPENLIMQLALLAEYLEQQHVTPEQVSGVRTAADLAKLVGADPEALERGYAQSLRERLRGESMLNRPEWRKEVPDALLDALAERARSMAGLSEFTANLLDARIKDGKATVLSLEEFRLSGRPCMVVLTQEWVLQGGRWLLARTPDPLALVGR